MKARDCQYKIPSADTVASGLHARIVAIEAELKVLLQKTCSTLAISLDRWTSQNSLPMLAINGTWLGPNFQQYRACLEFIEIKGSHSGENLSLTVFGALKRLDVLQKLLTITSDNASNNDTLCRHLHIKLSRLYDDHLEEIPLRDGRMRFKGEESHIRCFAHILNLVIRDILEDLGSSNHKDASAFLDRVAKNKWKKITLPGAARVIARLRIIVLWVARSPQRIQEWDTRENVTKAVNYDVDTRWNSTLRMIEDAFDCRAALEDTVRDRPELEDLKLLQADWKQLDDIRKMLNLLLNTLSLSLEYSHQFNSLHVCISNSNQLLIALINGKESTLHLTRIWSKQQVWVYRSSMSTMGI